MENFLEQMAELFEVDSVNLNDEIISFDAWDSLTGLSIIALADDEYDISVSIDNILNSKTIGGLYELFNQK
tara:strand:+ start:11394 stop:11606 length:213 start_codon:yes stop_codon:yes gene_type:complete